MKKSQCCDFPTLPTPTHPGPSLPVDPCAGLEQIAIGCDTSEKLSPQLMCDSGTPFIRWLVVKGGQPVPSKFVDTDLENKPYTPTDPAAVTPGTCEAPPEVCEPTVSSATADDVDSLLPGTSISIQKTPCCLLKVTTSAGSFLVAKDVTGYSTSDFKCPVTVTAVEIVSGDCDLAEVILTTQT